MTKNRNAVMIPPRWIVLAGLVIGLVLTDRSAGWGYEEVAPVSGGTISGKVFLKGAPPPVRIFHLVFSPNIDFCGRVSDGKGNRLLKEFRTSGDGGFQDVVVAVVGVKQGKKFDYTPSVDLENCRISPFVVPILNHHPIRLVNKDPIAHDIQAYTLKDDYTFAMFNKPMVPESTALKQIAFRQGHYLFRTQCGVHDYMQSWGMAVGNPYFAVTAATGEFTISDLPPGTYDVIAWHPYMKVQAQTVTVSADSRIALNFQFNTAEVEVPLYSLQEKYRLDTALQTHHLVPPSIELQSP